MMRRRARRLAVALLALTVGGLLAGCGGPAAASPGAPVATSQVTMPPSYRFDPPTIQVKAGSTVTWTNTDNFTHDVRLLGGDGWHSRPLPPGERTTHTFTQPGEYPYQCTFHSQNMKGTVVVTP